MKVYVGGHRGLGCTDSEHAVARNLRNGVKPPPENTLDSLLQALRAGADFVETDLIATADDEIVLTHSNDPRQHIHNARWMPAEGACLADMSLAQAQNLRIGETGEARVPTLRELLRSVLQEFPPDESRPFTLNLELKGVQGTTSASGKSLAEIVLRTIREENFPLERIRFSSFSTSMLEDMAKREPQARLGMLCDRTKEAGGAAGDPIFADSAEEYVPFTVDVLKQTLERLPNLEAVHPEITSLTPDAVAFCAERGLAIATWAWCENSPLVDDKFASAAKNAVEFCRQQGVLELSIITDHVADMQGYVANA